MLQLATGTFAMMIVVVSVMLMQMLHSIAVVFEHFLAYKTYDNVHGVGDGDRYDHVHGQVLLTWACKWAIANGKPTAWAYSRCIGYMMHVRPRSTVMVTLLMK